MNKKSLFFWFVAFICAALIFTGCPQEADDDDSVLSGTAELDTGAGSTVVKGVNVTFTPGTHVGTFADPIPGTVRVRPADAAVTDATKPTVFTAADSGSTRAVKVVSNSLPADAAAFDDLPSYSNEALAAGDVFYVRVTSQNGAATKWYTVTVDVGLGTDATLDQAGTEVKNVEVGTFGNETGTFAAPVQSTVTISHSAAADADKPTTFAKTDEYAAVKAVKVASAAAGTYTETAFNSASPYNDDAITTGDVFFVKVTAEDGTTVKWYKITVTVLAVSTDATLDQTDTLIKGVAATSYGSQAGAFDTPVEAAVSLTSTQASATTGTAFTATDDEAAVKAVKVASAAAGTYTETAFNSASPYNDDAITTGDVFFVKVTAEDGTTVKWYKITVTVSPVYTVTYDDNDSDGGTVPLDSGAYAAGASVTVADNTGSLTKSGHVFSGWTVQDGDGAVYPAAATYTIGDGDVTFVAAWAEIVTDSVTLDGTAGTNYTTGLSIASAIKLGDELTVVVTGTGITSDLGTANTDDFQYVSGSVGHGSNVGLAKIDGFYNGFDPSAEHIEWFQSLALKGYEDSDGWPPADNTTFYKVLTDTEAFTNLAKENPSYENDGVNDGSVFWKTSAGVYNKASNIAENDYKDVTARRVVLQEQDAAADQVAIYRIIVDSAVVYTVKVDYTAVTWAAAGSN